MADHPQDLLVLYLYGEASPAERTCVENHVADCATCREWLSHQQTLVVDLKALSDLPVPERLVARCSKHVTSLTTREGPAARLWSLLRPAVTWRRASALACACALLVVLTSSFEQGLRLPDTQTASMARHDGAAGASLDWENGLEERSRRLSRELREGRPGTLAWNDATTRRDGGLSVRLAALEERFSSSSWHRSSRYGTDVRCRLDDVQREIDDLKDEMRWLQ